VTVWSLTQRPAFGTPAGKVQPDAHRTPGGSSGHEGGKDHPPPLIYENVREGPWRMLAEALQAELDAYIARFADKKDLDGRRLGVRNGYYEQPSLNGPAS
jgi:hypothetical protein